MPREDVSVVYRRLAAFLLAETRSVHEEYQRSHGGVYHTSPLSDIAHVLLAISTPALAIYEACPAANPSAR